MLELRVEVREGLQRELVTRALAATGQNVSAAARALKISRKGLQVIMRRLEIRRGTASASRAAAPAIKATEMPPTT